MSVGKPIKKLGMRGSHIVQIDLDEALLSDDDRIGEEGQGFKIAMETYNLGRVMVAARGVGLAQAAFEKSLNYSISRKAFDQPIISHESIQNHLSDILMKLVASRLLVYWAANLFESQNPNYISAGSIAKTFASESA